MASTAHQPDRYFVPDPSSWPIFGSIALLLMTSGAVLWMNKLGSGAYVLLAGVAVLVLMLFGWFGSVIRESVGGRYNKRVDLSFRLGMGWFIFSEVMFFAAFFGALFYVRVLAVPDLATPDNQVLYPGFSGQWPSAGPGFKEMFTPMAAWGIPAINTLLLLSSGATVTWAHWGLLKDNRGQLKVGLALTILLGVLFISLQAYEYAHAYQELNLKLTTGIYGTTFFMLTGFHGLHVTLGAIMLIVILMRVLAGHFRSEHHFGFEAVAWYWHFVDVVWLCLFIFVYWL
ncbi:MAG TPA: cytochrome c oxidase subunit 3 [Rhodocyclaceae bacterium]|nr:MAG: cytochrome c oxidase subunit 3 [Betaproteobacteria bacterium CG2_30_68_42]PIV73936.1 MAG: cytochrome c oxidase subunit 3 [Rhodocyclales bacterium CG17_big_fil_post_rev_8_21_14_2_50_68_7]PIX75452.1 MAG: cytochrome c oxidase subunit 3 [Rhodocyclales bacterium CG_4_10_14_3_um_filter_68_10]PJA58469.1 MAG: cytochrome c oxidase subunit 3 [Rhodocyclales bacterium CG_4_9_14_3_um_filter_68_10]HCX32197.1 cytochrome c oxidase subunit 3 [Rhodocyclaceae bacterium]